MIKKITATILTTVLTLVVLCVPASANSISPRTKYLMTCSSTLSISGTTATCSSGATGYYGETTKISVSQILQKQNFWGDWEKVERWDETDYGFKCDATNYAYNLSSGKYRLRSVFTVYVDGDSEVITKDSYENTVANQDGE